MSYQVSSKFVTRHVNFHLVRLCILKNYVFSIINANYILFRTVVKVNIGKSQALYSGHSKSAKEKNSALITIGPINVDIPQHPVALHGMMTRSSKQISNTLQELRVPRGPLRHS